MTQQPVFIQVGALADGFAPDNNTLPARHELTGRAFELFAEGGECYRLQLLSNDKLCWTAPGSAPLEADSRVTSLREGIYLIDFLPPAPVGASVSVVLDAARGLFTLVDGRMPDEADTRIDPFTRVARGMELTAVQADFVHGVVGRPPAQDDALHHATTELVGMRNQYRYSRTECYEHVYLNNNFYAWQCLQGVEQGLADVDRCHYIKLAEALYLFVWREKIIPTLGVVLIDLAQGKTDGKIVGYQGGDFGALSNFAVGASAQVLNLTRHQLT